MNKKPNILFILTDDQRFNTINALGYEQLKTPNMDFLVNTGTTFTHAHIPGGTCPAVCMPSRAMINTGRTLYHLQDNGESIPKDHTMIGEHLQKNGYYAFGTGKWHNGTKSSSRNFNDGDNLFFGGMWDHWNVPANSYDPTGEYSKTVRICPDPFNSNFYFTMNCNKMQNGVHSTDLLSNTAIDFIEKYNEDKPFYLYTSYLAPHDPRTMPNEFKTMYNPDDIELPENFMSEHPFDFGVTDIRDETLEAYPRTETAIRKHLAEYYAMISHLDYQIGRLIDTLKTKGILDNTIIILTGDNGLAVGSHGLMGKQNAYEHSMRIPLIFKGPGIPQNKRIDNYVYLSDIYPTLCDMLEIEIPKSVECPSFAKMFNNSSYQTYEEIYFSYADLLRSVKDKNYKLIEYRNGITKAQLFDIIKDPNELNDLAEQPEYKKIKENLRDIMFSYRDRWGDDKTKIGKSYWDNF